ncbi:Phosphoglycerate mutase family 2 (fragment) [Hyella patelloides LEGE 07179]|uniref:Phosphoglycerate mutase family 2 n=1 Tax=Hyella patelloides LEGE 07179 TaxID=945734 RepID=A0A563VIX2_9CYAN
MKREFYLVRHCQATGQESDAPLTKLGKQQAISLIDYLTDFDIKHIISSPFLRTGFISFF